MTSTKDDLKAAFAGESQANRRYLAFAKRAEDEGFSQIAKLLRATAEAETIHALSHLQVMGGVERTEINLEHAIGGERYEHTEMYPSFIITAKNESNKAAERTFTLANKVEQIHEGKFQTALQAVRTGKDLPKKKLFVCPVCGNIEEGEAPEHCAVCGAAGSSFKEVN